MGGRRGWVGKIIDERLKDVPIQESMEVMFVVIMLLSGVAKREGGGSDACTS